MEDIFDLHVLRMRLGGFINYSYLGIDKSFKYAFVVDPAWELKKIIEPIKNSDATLKAILLTHSHFDHINLVNKLIEIYNPLVYISDEEKKYYNFKCNNLVTLNNMEEFLIGDIKGLCLLTPGHTKGGMCYLVENNLFTGDTVFIEGCGLCENYVGSAEQMYESIQMIKKVVPNDVCVFPGHSYGKNPGKTISYLLKENIYFQIDNIKHFIDFRNRKNQKGLFNFK